MSQDPYCSDEDDEDAEYDRDEADEEGEEGVEGEAWEDRDEEYAGKKATGGKQACMGRSGGREVCEGKGGGKGPAGAKKPAASSCPRRGSRRRKNNAADIGQMECQEDCSHCQGQEGQRSSDGWTHDPKGGPPMTQNAAILLTKLLGVYTREGRNALDQLLQDLDRVSPEDNGCTDIDVSDTAALVKKIKKQDHRLKVAELEHMLSLVQLALNVDRYAVSGTNKIN